ncbi:MAG: hypothetical protein ABIG11_06865 [bacterium]
METPKYCAHTSNRPDGAPAPQCEWQPLKDHLQNAAALAKKFAGEARLRRTFRLCRLESAYPETRNPPLPGTVELQQGLDTLG